MLGIFAPKVCVRRSTRWASFLGTLRSARSPLHQNLAAFFNPDHSYHRSRQLSEEHTSRPIRANKAVAKLLKISRREAEKYLTGKRVQKNGVTISNLATSIDLANDKVAVDGKVLKEAKERVLKERPRLWLCHKYAGELVTMDDPQQRPTIFQRLERLGLPAGLKSVGRLDYNTSGLILFTNDGQLKRALEHPKASRLTRKYRVKVKGKIRRSWLSFLRSGAKIKGIQYRPIRVKIVKEGKPYSHLEVELNEGKKNEVRRVLSAGGMFVNELKRIEFGPYNLKNLKPGSAIEVKLRH